MIAEVLIGSGAEIFVSSEGLMVCDKRQIKNIDKATLLKLKVFARSRMHAYVDMAGPKESDQLLQCASCMFSSLDGKADIDENGNLTPEIVSCNKRGFCKWEGIGCLPKPINVLSPAQQRVAALCTLPAKIIADKLCISHFTVKRHLDDAKKALGAKNIAELVKILN